MFICAQSRLSSAIHMNTSGGYEKFTAVKRNGLNTYTGGSGGSSSNSRNNTSCSYTSSTYYHSQQNIPHSSMKERIPMSSISSRGPSSVSENDNRMRNSSRTSGNMVTSQQDTPPPSPTGSNSDRGSKACCFCWCCCCSCSCLTVKNGEDNKPRPSNISLNEKEEPPSAEEVLQWSESFDRLMQSNAGRKVFREFLRSEYSEENMLFWIACEDLKTTENPEMVEEKARLIYEDYISILSPKEVSLDSRVRELINRSMVEPTPYTFDEAQLQIYTLMHRDSYPRFLNSSIYKKLVQQFEQQQ